MRPNQTGTVGVTFLGFLLFAFLFIFMSNNKKTSPIVTWMLVLIAAFILLVNSKNFVGTFFTTGG